MRPLFLKLENFGPFLNESIDFKQIQTNQLFLISGKTGSGKTMIFDAIVYALYGRASTTSREVAQLRSHFASPELPLKVTYEFEIHQQRYKVIRTAAFTKPNKKSETKGILEVYQYKNNQEILLESKINAGNQFLQELLNLKVDQFRQLFILPQGEFKSFLVSKSQDKQSILRTLFNTVMYEDLKNELKEKTKSIQNEMDKTSNKLETYWHDLYTLEDDTLNEYRHIDIHQHEKIREVIPIFEAIGEQKISRLSQKKLELEKQLKHIQECLDQETLRRQLQQEYNTVTQQLTSLETEKEQIQQLEQKIHILKQSQFALHTLNEREEVKKEHATNESSIKALQSKSEALKNKMNEQQKQLKQLDSQQTEIDIKTQTLKKTHYYYQNEREMQKAFEKQNALGNKIKQSQKDLTDLEQQYQRTMEKYKDQTFDFEQMDSLKEHHFSLRTELEKIEFTEQQYQLKLKHETEQKSLKSEIDELEIKTKQLEEKKHVFSKTDQSILSHDKMIQTLQSEIQLAEPCPVCGQIVHELDAVHQVEPLREKLKENDGIDQQLRQIEKQLIKKKATLEQIQSQLETLKDVQNVESKKRELTVLKNKCEEQLEEMAEAKLNFEKLKTKKQEQEAQYQELKQHIELNQYQLEMAMQKVKQFKDDTDFDQYDDFKSTYEKMELEVNVFTKTYEELKNAVQELQGHYNIFENDLKHQRERATSLQAQEQKLNSTLHEEMKKLNIKSVSELEQLMTEAHEVQALEMRVQQYHQALQKYTAQKESVYQKLQELPKQPLETLQNEYTSVQEKLADVTQQFNETQFQIQQNKVKTQKIEQILNEIQQAMSEHRSLFHLAEVISGKNQQNLTLENYVLIYYLEHILESANKRLLNMTGQRYELVRKGDKGRGYSGLEIEVYDYYSNQTRHITSLSGGETFQASLALALGLSEVVQNEQGGISLDAMFIDEGFGTLDQETLETALDTLIHLQASGRLVGIISHVTELKNRIPLILEVNSSQYYSSTTIKHNE